MKALELDFHRVRPAAPWAGWLLLALGLAFIADVGVSYYRASTSIAEQEARLEALEGSAAATTRSPAARDSATPEELAVARETIARLSMPWDDLFGALEGAATDRVALLALEPDRETGTVLIRGEAGDYAGVLDYVQQLGRAGTLSQVHLVKHERRDAGSAAGSPNAVAFSVSARWKEAVR